PAAVHLAVLVDRGGRELPIEPQFSAARVSLSADQKLRLIKDEAGGFTFDVKGN
ncbi:MAG TPA: bifunctional pyr operon transcriptional regulator/uracil phosphoribosyltransferase PyrR, partial [Burkholderiaceae bacterium]